MCFKRFSLPRLNTYFPRFTVHNLHSECWDYFSEPCLKMLMCLHPLSSVWQYNICLRQLTGTHHTVSYVFIVLQFSFGRNGCKVRLSPLIVVRNMICNLSGEVFQKIARHMWQHLSVFHIQVLGDNGLLFNIVALLFITPELQLIQDEKVDFPQIKTFLERNHVYICVVKMGIHERGTRSLRFTPSLVC